MSVCCRGCPQLCLPPRNSYPRIFKEYQNLRKPQKTSNKLPTNLKQIKKHISSPNLIPFQIPCRLPKCRFTPLAFPGHPVGRVWIYLWPFWLFQTPQNLNIHVLMYLDHPFFQFANLRGEGTQNVKWPPSVPTFSLFGNSKRRGSPQTIFYTNDSEFLKLFEVIWCLQSQL